MSTTCAHAPFQPLDHRGEGLDREFRTLALRPHDLSACQCPQVVPDPVHRVSPCIRGLVSFSPF
ncbi:hypothetical protein TIFTF001_030147 [Ficus carica]|uniref:Uncharacterized protein n=1 Tax=Ficus carica TaxID=3494 RepID=A0AA88DTA8_FICCA|nr:hypothetical protein TIFTF001_030147 [Ficus carica]